MAQKIEKVGVLGAGLMGHGIAQVAAQAGYEVVLREVDDATLQKGIGKIEKQLARAVGLGGRDRKAASNVERARVNVQRRLKDAVRRIAEHDGALGRYLDATVRTGTYCVYRPV